MIYANHLKNDLFEKSDYALPTKTYAEQESTIINIGGLIKTSPKMINPVSSSAISIWEICEKIYEIKDIEINRIIKFIKEQKRPEYQEDIFTVAKIAESTTDEEEEFDEKYDEAVALVAREQQASISMVQRKLRVGYNRAARMIEVMEKEGVVGRSDGIKPREVYIKEIPA